MIRKLALGAAALAALFVWLGSDDDRGRRATSPDDARRAARDETPNEKGRTQGRGREAGDAADADEGTRADWRASGGDDVFEDAPREGEADSAASERSAASDVSPIALAPLRESRAPSTVALAGYDPFAPRELLAWRIANGRFAIAARGSSDRDGNLLFPDLVAAQDGLEIVVTPADSAPGLPGASEPRSWAARDPVSPLASVVESDVTGHRLRIAPREATGVMVLADAYGVELARFPVRASPIPATRDVEVELTATSVESYVLLSHEFSDGRSSEWETVVLPAVEGEAE